MKVGDFKSVRIGFWILSGGMRDVFEYKSDGTQGNREFF